MMPDDNRLRERRRPGQAGQSSMITLKQLPALVVLERLPVAVLAIDHDGTILFANAMFAAMLPTAYAATLTPVNRSACLTSAADPTGRS